MIRIQSLQKLYEDHQEDHGQPLNVFPALLPGCSIPGSGPGQILILLSEHEEILSGYIGEGYLFHLLCQTYLELTGEERAHWLDGRTAWDKDIKGYINIQKMA